MDKIKATIVLEILGKPAEHIKEALGLLVNKLEQEKGLRVIDKTLHEPVPVPESKEIFTTFAELSLEFDSLENCFGILFAYMPSHIEISSPANINLSNSNFNEITNKLLARLHDYDAITKKFVYERNFLIKKLKEVAPEFFKQPDSQEKPKDSSNEEENKKGKRKSSKKSEN